MIYKKLKNPILSKGVGNVIPFDVNDLALKSKENIYTARNVFNAPVNILDAINDNEPISKQQLEQAIANIPVTDLTDYYTKTETDQKISDAIQAIPPTDLSDLMTKAEGQDLKDYVDAQDVTYFNESKLYTDNQIALIPPTDLTNYYTKPETDTKIQELIDAIPPVDLSNYYNKGETDQKITDAINAIPPVPPTDLSDYYNKAETDQKDQDILQQAKDYTDANAGAGGNVDLTNYYTKQETDDRDTQVYTNARDYTDQAIANIPPAAGPGGLPTTLAYTDRANTFRAGNHYVMAGNNHRMMISNNAIQFGLNNGGNWADKYIISLHGANARVKSGFVPTDGDDVINKAFLDRVPFVRADQSNTMRQEMHFALENSNYHILKLSNAGVRTSINNNDLWVIGMYGNETLLKSQKAPVANEDVVNLRYFNQQAARVNAPNTMRDVMHFSFSGSNHVLKLANNYIKGANDFLVLGMYGNQTALFTNSEPRDDNGVVNKRYLNKRLQGLGGGGGGGAAPIGNYAELDQDNTFTGTNSFNGHVQMNDVTAESVRIDDAPVNDFQAANKIYVDQQVVDAKLYADNLVQNLPPNTTQPPNFNLFYTKAEIDQKLLDLKQTITNQLQALIAPLNGQIQALSTRVQELETKADRVERTGVFRDRVNVFTADQYFQTMHIVAGDNQDWYLRIRRDGQQTWIEGRNATRLWKAQHVAGCGGPWCDPNFGP